MLIIPISGRTTIDCTIDYQPVMIVCLITVTCGPLTNQKRGKRVKMCEYICCTFVCFCRQLAPFYYSSVRLHSGYLPDGITGDKFHIKQTVFLDYTARQKDSSVPTKRSVKQWKPQDLKTAVPYLAIHQ